MFLFYFIYSGGSFKNQKINKINIIFFHLIYSGGSFENKINKIDKIYIYSDLSSFPKKSWEFNK